METREEFEKWAAAEGYKIDKHDGAYKYMLTYQAYNFWKLRQPQIDALEAENERLRWLANRYWVQEQAEFRLGLKKTEFEDEYLVELHRAIAARKDFLTAKKEETELLNVKN